MMMMIVQEKMQDEAALARDTLAGHYKSTDEFHRVGLDSQEKARRQGVCVCVCVCVCVMFVCVCDACVCVCWICVCARARPLEVVSV